MSRGDLSTGRDLAATIAFLQHRNPQLVSLSPHDTCDWSIEAFRSAFRDPCYELRPAVEDPERTLSMKTV